MTPTGQLLVRLAIGELSPQQLHKMEKSWRCPMGSEIKTPRFSSVGNGSGFAQTTAIYHEELQLATRNRGMPLEGMRYSITPTGLHYLLIHYDIPVLDLNSFRLVVDGRVDKPLTFTLDEIKQMPAQTLTVTMECAGNGRALLAPRRISQPWLNEAIGTAEWTGVPVRFLLDAAGLGPDTVEIVFTGFDRGVEGDEVQNYQRSLSVNEASRSEVLLAYQMNGAPLEPQHGYPLRLVVPGWYGMTSVKWLGRIDAVSAPFQGYQMVSAYRYWLSADTPGEPVNLIRPRALMIPPGIPDFMTRTRLLPVGPVTLAGKAWAGRRHISCVEVSVDSGSSWTKGQLGEAVSPFAWTSWTFNWNARPGRYSLCTRATDSDGNQQPMEQAWNIGGYGNNSVQHITVLVE